MLCSLTLQCGFIQLYPKPWSSRHSNMLLLDRQPFTQQIILQQIKRGQPASHGNFWRGSGKMQNGGNPDASFQRAGNHTGHVALASFLDYLATGAQPTGQLRLQDQHTGALSLQPAAGTVKTS